MASPYLSVASPVYLVLKVNGVTVEGDGPRNAIECLYYRQAVAREVSNGMTAGHPTYEPLVIRKRIDKSSPLLAQALTENRVVDGVFHFTRVNVQGEEEPYFATEIRHGRIAALTQFVTDVEEPADLRGQPLEELAFVFNEIYWTWPLEKAAAGGAAAGSAAASGSWTAAGGAPAGAGAAPGWAANGSGAAAGGKAASGAAGAGSAAPPATPPEPLRRMVAERPSRVAAIVPLTDRPPD